MTFSDIEDTQTNNDQEKGWFKFERKGLDFPFYKNNPHIGLGKWILFLISPLIVLIFTPPLPYSLDGVLRFVFMLIFFGYIANWKYGLIFKKFQKGDLILIPVIVIAGIFFSMIMNVIVSSFGVTGHENPVFQELGSYMFWFRFPFDIFLEEFLKLAPFLATLTLVYQGTKKRRISIIIATIVTLTLFGLLHTDSVGNIIVALTTIGIPSVLDVFAYIKTKNIMVTYLTHLIFDIVLFILSMMFS